MTSFARSFSSILLLIFFGVFLTSVSAQELTDTIKLDLFTGQETVSGQTIKIDAEYAATYNIEIPQPFQILLPEREGVNSFVHNADQPDTPLFKVSFFGRDEDNPQNIYLIEDIEFIRTTIAMNTPEDRIGSLAALLINQVFPAALESVSRGEFFGARPIKIGDLNAVEAFGTFVDPDAGRMMVRIVGVIPAHTENAVISISNIAAQYFDIGGPDDLAATNTGIIMREFKYLLE